MGVHTENLQSVMEHFGMTNKALAEAMGVDPSYASRVVAGKRSLPAASRQMDALTESVLKMATRVSDIEWLKEQFHRGGLSTDTSTVYQIKQNLTMWLASDGTNLRRNLGGHSDGDASALKPPAFGPAENTVFIGFRDVVLRLEPLLSHLKDGGSVDIFLSSDRIATVTNGDFSRLLLHHIEKRSLAVRLVACVSGNTEAMSRLIHTYMSTMISGHVRISVVHGMTQTVTHQMHMILGDDTAALITETVGGATPPVAVIVTEASFVRQTIRSFEESARYAQPLVNVYGDSFARNILEIIYSEFSMPGDLDVVKDSINPMYMTHEGYTRYLAKMWRDAYELSWRSEEFRRFKAGMDEALCGDTVFREILPLSRLNQIAWDGWCRLPGLYFMNKGFVRLDAEGCLDLLNGYLLYLENTPNFHLMIVDDVPLLHSENCWQLKKNHHLAINYWQSKEPVMIHSDQLMLLREFQAYFDRLWAQGKAALKGRAGVIALLKDIIKKLESGMKNGFG